MIKRIVKRERTKNSSCQQMLAMTTEATAEEMVVCPCKQTMLMVMEGARRPTLPLLLPLQPPR